MGQFGPTRGEQMLQAMVIRYWIGLGVKSVLVILCVAALVKWLAS